MNYLLPRRWVTPSPALSPGLKGGAASSPTSVGSGRDKVLTGRVSKISPKDKQKAQHEDALDEKERQSELERYEEMEAEKELFPGSKGWTEDEERLFEILFMRQYSPLLPAHWDMDFRGIPVPDVLFATSEIDQPIIYAHSENEFKATRALINLIELTTSVRCLSQTGQRNKIPALIKKELDAYSRWAAQDGDYEHLDVVPNLIIEIADTTMSSEAIEGFMKMRLITLAMIQRQFWRIDDYPADIGKRYRSALDFHKENSVKTAVRREIVEDDDNERELENQVVLVPTSIQSTPVKSAKPDFGMSPSKANEPKFPAKEDAQLGSEVRYSRQPPVLYGLFIVNGSVMVLTLDSAKEGDDAYVSYQVEVGFNKRNQGVWNAMTIAIVVCLARDEMMSRTDGFRELGAETDSDPDA